MLVLLSGFMATTLAWNYCNAAEAAKETTKETTNSNLAKVSEAFGNFIGKTLSNPNSGIRFDIENVIKGIREGAAGKPSPLSEQDYEKAISELQESAFKDMSETNLKTANEFMVTNAKEKNIVVVEPGKLQYMILTEGKGPTVNEHSSPLIHYTGKFIDGSVFGSSEETGPISISLDRTIPGFSKGLVGMKQGEKRRLFIHPDLAYGTRGDLPPNAMLIFDVEVVNANGDENANAEGKKNIPGSDGSSDQMNGNSDEQDDSDENSSDSAQKGKDSPKHL